MMRLLSTAVLACGLAADVGGSTYEMTKRDHYGWTAGGKPLTLGSHYDELSLNGFAITNLGSERLFR